MRKWEWDELPLNWRRNISSYRFPYQEARETQAQSSLHFPTQRIEAEVGLLLLKEISGTNRFSMKLKRRVGDVMYFGLLILGNIGTAVALSGDNDKIDHKLDCTNDFDKTMSCHFEAPNCAEYNLTLHSNNGYGEKHCILKQCDNASCCCSVQMTLVLGESHTANISKGLESMESKIIRIRDSIKPQTPTIVSVTESNGNFQVIWKNNVESSWLSESLTATVTYYKKGDTEKVSESFKPSTFNGLNFYEILGRVLESHTTYVLSVKSYTASSDRFSDSSEEVEFTTPVSPNALLFAIVISLSIAAFIITGAIYACYVKFITTWLESFAKCPNPKLLIMHPSEQEVLKPMPLIISSVCVELRDPDDSKAWLKESLRDTSSGSLQHSSGISTGSSCLSYANTEPLDIIAGVQDALQKAFPNISPTSPWNTNPLTELNKDSGLLSVPYNPCGVRVKDTSSGSFGFDNKTYSILIPSCPREIMTDSSEVQTQAEMLFDSAYHPSEGDIEICPVQQVPACLVVNLPPVDSSLMPTDMSYHQCNADLGRFSPAEDSSLSSISSGTNTTASCDPVSRVEGLDGGVTGATKLNEKTEEAIISNENPCYVPAGSHSSPPVDDDYQAFQSLVEQPGLLFSEKRSVEKEESFTKRPQSLGPVPGSINSVQGGQCLSELQRHFLSLISADQSIPVITGSGYQSV